jgi:2'-5' RNA ligase
VTARDTVEGDERIRVFLALEVPDEVAETLAEWGREYLPAGRRVDTVHVTLAFLGGQPRSGLAEILRVLRYGAAATEPFLLEPRVYRETRSVGMLVLDDQSGRATDLAERVQGGLEDLGVYDRERRRWLPHLTVLRFRDPPRLAPPLPAVAAFAPSGAAAFLSRLHPTGARYEVLESYALGVTEEDLEAGG